MLFFGPRDPVAEMLWFDGITRHGRLRFQIDRMQIKAFRAGNVAKGLLQVGA
ncbi:hypothetical protein OS21_44770 [Dickeya oryzae]